MSQDCPGAASFPVNQEAQHCLQAKPGHLDMSHPVAEGHQKGTEAAEHGT